MTIEELHNRTLIIFDCISGSLAYGLATEGSDTDVKGVFVLLEDTFYGLEHADQVNNETNDISYYELSKFAGLLAKSNPTILELLFTPPDSIRKEDPLFSPFRKVNVLSKACKDSFGGYAMTQIRKAKGLNKKILNPMEKKRKGVMDFCYVAHQQGAIPLEEFLSMKNIDQRDCGLSRVPHMHEIYALYHGAGQFHGIVKGPQANEVSLSSIPKGLAPIGVMSFNKSAWSKYCKDHREYWEWVTKRNDARYQNTLYHGKNYDSKNMMHTFRLLHMCEEIGKEGVLRVRRDDDRDFLLQIKRGEFEYEELVKRAEEKISEIEKIYATSDLPDLPDVEGLNGILVEVRRGFYGR